MSERPAEAGRFSFDVRCARIAGCATTTSGARASPPSTCSRHNTARSFPNWYRPEYPAFVEADYPAERSVLISFGEMRGPLDEREPVHIEDAIERRYVVRQVKQRIHQAQFRGAVLPAYRDLCAICSLKQIRLLDAAHITGDAEEHGAPLVSNGISLCSIHHRAFDQDLVGIDPSYVVRLAPGMLADEDGPMLELLKGFDAQPIALPRASAHRPDKTRLAERYERFLERTR